MSRIQEKFVKAHRKQLDPIVKYRYVLKIKKNVEIDKLKKTNKMNTCLLKLCCDNI